jgi:hypothetical protein
MAPNDPLEILASTGILKLEPPGQEEIAGLLFAEHLCDDCSEV